MIDLVLKILGAGLSLWADKEKNKYVDRMMYLREQYRAEMNKPESARSGAVLDNIEFEIKNLALAFTAASGQKDG